MTALGVLLVALGSLTAGAGLKGYDVRDVLRGVITGTKPARRYGGSGSVAVDLGVTQGMGQAPPKPGTRGGQSSGQGASAGW